MKFSESKAEQKSKLGELVKSGISREGVDSPANQSSGISSFNSDHVQLQNTQVWQYNPADRFQFLRFLNVFYLTFFNLIGILWNDLFNKEFFIKFAKLPFKSAIASFYVIYRYKSNQAELMITQIQAFDLLKDID